MTKYATQFTDIQKNELESRSHVFMWKDVLNDELQELSATQIYTGFQGTSRVTA
jgi:hypothetical protein